MFPLQTFISAAACVAIVAIIVFGISSCQDRDASLRQNCIKSGGSVIPAAGGSFACVRGSIAQ